MLPSMYSAISGLHANQKKLDVVGNNIANSSTTAFKSQSVTYEDVMSQTVASGSGASSSTGGINPQQIGMGVQVSSIDTDTTTGDMQPTNNPLDCMIDGKGYFVVGTGQLPEDSSSTDAGTIGQEDEATHLITPNSVDVTYTRDGSFKLDPQGNLHTASGLRVYGYPNTNAVITYSTDTNTQHTVDVTNDGTAEISGDALVPMVIPDYLSIDGEKYPVTQVSIGNTGLITATCNSKSVVLGQLAEVSFSNEKGLSKMGNNTYSISASSGNAILRNREGADAANINSGEYGSILSNKLEASNVDLATQFTDMIVASRAFEANGKIITTDDSILETLVNLKR
ncbi:flagellar hook-basal body complex protein [Clostridium fermenticellae]|uniref:Flagellar hook-basal body complex protein n=1 Tax=Clostridium fermenticellae TaxID=2068654 RepID=A0A386H538_9CLOT|nr:flagellar hook-basal body complex protein [Clostridium fermenticellae]AYD40678.1 flagellar hook-basal body complex protein [Clostridium fermenticellae]